MQDRFKFRLFDKSINEMSYDVCVGFIKDSSLLTRDWVCADTTCGQINYTDKKLNDIVLMQCTGLKDKNDRLIYEGDIVKYFYKKSKTNPEKPRATDNFIVKWCERGNWTLYTTDNKESLLLGICLKEIEVIGNIYENPELLNEGEQ